MNTNDQKIPYDQDGQKKKIFTRKDEDLDLKSKLLSGPELFITDKSSDESLDRLSLKVKLRGGDEFVLADHVLDDFAKYDYKFYKDWYYVLADLYRVDKKLMDKYVKPKFVPMFKIHFIYARFPFELLKELRRKSPLVFPGYSSLRTHKLYHGLSKDTSDQMDIIIEQCYEVMKERKSVMDFKKQYSQLYKVYYQVDLFPEEYN